MGDILVMEQLHYHDEIRSSDEVPRPDVVLKEHYNPVFFLIDGFRYGFIGAHDAPLLTGALVSGVLGARALLGVLGDAEERVSAAELDASPLPLRERSLRACFEAGEGSAVFAEAGREMVDAG